jgi:hypothetical protein
VIAVLVISVLVAGVALALVLSAGDDGDETANTAPTATTETTETAETVTTETAATTETGQAERQEQEEVQQTIVTFVDSAEQSDSAACEQLTVGGEDLESCAAAVGINLRFLPSSDELQVDSVDVNGNRATARLSNGASFSLRQSGGRWKISGFRPPAGSPGGGQQAPGDPDPGR